MISSSSQFQFYVVPVPMHLRQIIRLSRRLGPTASPRWPSFETKNWRTWCEARPFPWPCLVDVDVYLGFIVEILQGLTMSWTGLLLTLSRSSSNGNPHGGSAVFSFATSEGGKKQPKWMIISTIVKALVTNVRITTLRLLCYPQISPCYEQYEQISFVFLQHHRALFRGPSLPSRYHSCPPLQVMPPYWLWIVPWWPRQRDAERKICAEARLDQRVNQHDIMILDWYIDIL